MRITEKGQVTIPVAIRERFGLLPHTEVQFVIEDGDVVLRPVRAAAEGRGQKAVARLRGSGNVRMTTDEIMSLTRGT